MQKGHQLHFACTSCGTTVNFSLYHLDLCQCPSCGQEYSFDDADLKNQLQRFVALCETIKNAEDLLSHTNVGVDVGGHHVEIPYKLLLTRLNTSLDLQLGEKNVKITFRMEPLLEEKR